MILSYLYYDASFIDDSHWSLESVQTYVGFFPFESQERKV